MKIAAGAMAARSQRVVGSGCRSASAMRSITVSALLNVDGAVRDGDFVGRPVLAFRNFGPEPAKQQPDAQPGDIRGKRECETIGPTGDQPAVNRFRIGPPERCGTPA